jgi:DNA-binding transcriptional LysR family regulator
VQAALDGRLLVKPLAGYTVPSRPLHLVYASDGRVPPQLQSFIEFAVDAFGTKASQSTTGPST